MVSAPRDNVFVAGRALVIWFAMLGTAVANGAVREALLIPKLGERAAHVVSTITLSAAILLIAKLTIGWIGPATRGQALTIGLVWVTLTLCFEFVGGHYVFGHAWSRLLADYNIAAGRIWILILITTAVAPVIFTRAPR